MGILLTIVDFFRAFESLIESRTCSSTERLYYLEQYTTGDVKELIKSCHHLPPDVGYVIFLKRGLEMNIELLQRMSLRLWHGPL